MLMFFGAPNHAETLRVGWNSADALNLKAAHCAAKLKTAS
jgi:hypothetical protein